MEDKGGYQMEDYREEEVELIDYLRVIAKRKTIVILVTFLSLIVSAGFGSIRYPIKYITKIVISLNFPGIEKHKYPDGTLFDPRDIIAPKILSIAASHLEDNPLIEDLRSIIWIQPVIPPEIKEEMEKAKKEKRSFEFFPHQFSLTLTTKNRMMISPEERGKVLYAIIDGYRKEFERRYGEEPLIATDFPKDLLSTYDYIDIVTIFKVRIDNAIKFLDAKIGKAGFFRSKQTGRSFIDIKDDIEVIEKTMLSKAESTTRTLNLTKNSEVLINQHKHRIRQLDLDKQKKDAEASVAINLLKEAKKEPLSTLQEGRSTSTKGEPNITIESGFIEGLIKRSYLQTLVETALKAGIEAHAT